MRTPAMDWHAPRQTKLAAWGLALVLFSAGPATAPPVSARADAAERDDRAAVRSLLERGADASGPQPDGMTALHWAAHRGNLEIARLLIGARADVRAANRYGVTPLSLACTNGDAAL